jgi:EAL domain-containing protein (putative c-di-GMP-specific phosphodiesterase class I)
MQRRRDYDYWGPDFERLDDAIAQAVATRELFLLYQPRISVETKRLCGAEALVRWAHPERGVMVPADFLDGAEKRGSIGAIDDFVLDQACSLLADWEGTTTLPEGFTLAVNISVSELADPCLAERVGATLGRHGVNPARLCLEVTELASGKAADNVRADLGRLGVRLAVDNYPMGYSGLGRLQHLQPDSLAIDRCFAGEVLLVRSTVELAHSLCVRTLGKGVETEEQLAVLTASGCDEAQGFHIGYPMLPAVLERLWVPGQ